MRWALLEVGAFVSPIFILSTECLVESLTHGPTSHTVSRVEKPLASGNVNLLYLRPQKSCAPKH